MKKRSSSRLSVDTDDGNNTSGGSLVRQLSLSRSPSMRRYNEGMQRLKDTFRNHKKTAALDTVSEESMMSPPPSPLLVHTASKESGDSSKPLTPHATVESLLYDVGMTTTTAMMTMMSYPTVQQERFLKLSGKLQCVR